MKKMLTISKANAVHIKECRKFRYITVIYHVYNHDPFSIYLKLNDSRRLAFRHTSDRFLSEKL